MLLFAYGTLMDPDVRAVVLGREAGPVTAARLSGWRRAPATGEGFPMLLPDPGGSVDGLLVGPLSDTERRRVQFFEGVRQVLATVPVVCAARGPLTALACLGAQGPDVQGLTAGEGDWHLAGWQASHKSWYLPATVDYMACFGRTDLDTALRRWTALKPGSA